MSQVQRYKVGKTIWTRCVESHFNHFPCGFYHWNDEELLEEQLLEMGATPLPEPEEEEIEELPVAIVDGLKGVAEEVLKNKKKINELIKAVNQHSKAITELQKKR